MQKQQILNWALKFSTFLHPETSISVELHRTMLLLVEADDGWAVPQVEAGVVNCLEGQVAGEEVIVPHPERRVIVELIGITTPSTHLQLQLVADKIVGRYFKM